MHLGAEATESKFDGTGEDNAKESTPEVTAVVKTDEDKADKE